MEFLNSDIEINSLEDSREFFLGYLQKNKNPRSQQTVEGDPQTIKRKDFSQGILFPEKIVVTHQSKRKTSLAVLEFIESRVSEENNGSLLITVSEQRSRDESRRQE